MIIVSTRRVLKIKLSVKNQIVARRGVQVGFWGIAILLGALHTYAAATSYSMNADGISYLDIGDAYFRGDWETAINPV